MQRPYKPRKSENTGLPKVYKDPAATFDVYLPSKPAWKAYWQDDRGKLATLQSSNLNSAYQKRNVAIINKANIAGLKTKKEIYEEWASARGLESPGIYRPAGVAAVIPEAA